MTTVIVVGGGIWGASARQCFLDAGREVIWIDDATDAASDDVARIIRAEYVDPGYRELAARSLQIFRRHEIYSTYFHESGWFLVQDSQDGPDRSIPNGPETVAIETFLQQFPDACVSESSTITKTSGVGWTEAGRLHQALKAGAEIHHGTVTGLLCDGTACHGVKVGEQEFCADLVVLATGWRTNGLLRSHSLPLMPYEIVGAPALGVQLSEEQYAKYKDNLILCDPERGEILPPTPERILRVNNPKTFALDCNTAKAPAVTPAHPYFKESWEFLKRYYPDLGDCSVAIAKVCTDALTENQSFYVEPVEGVADLVCVGGGSFHSWKFRPVLSKVIASRLKLPHADASWAELIRSQSKKHAGVVPRRNWEW